MKTVESAQVCLENEEEEKGQEKWEENNKRNLTVTGSVDDSSLVAPRWHPPELRGGRTRLAADRCCCHCRRSTKPQVFIIVTPTGGHGQRCSVGEWTGHLNESEEGQMLRTTFV